ncbi:MAG TPA: peptidoglycan-binding protein [Terriglobia bacterium]|nr:peptidoglycan-binding protein [Terriglobia bacterium]
MLTDLQKRTAQAIVNIFETGSARGHYGSVTLIPGDTGHLTYGRSQTTLGSGNLHRLIKSYCAAPDARFAPALSPFLGRLAACDAQLDTDPDLHRALRHAGDDPAMQREQDQFFDRIAWTPSLEAAARAGLATALATSVVYDGHIQGAWGAIRDRTNAAFGEAATIGEEAWVSRYVETRRRWLGNHPNAALHATVYRMDAFLELVRAGHWHLPLPLTVRGVVISEEVLCAPPPPGPALAAAREVGARLLRLEDPPLAGEDVTALQQALAGAGVEVAVDGSFGEATESALKRYQSAKGLVADGIVGPATRESLGLQ